MTGDTLPTTWLGRLIEAGKVAGAVAAIAALLGGLWAVTVGPVRGYFASQAALREAVIEQGANLQENGEALARVANDVHAVLAEQAIVRTEQAALREEMIDLLRPTKVFEVAPSSRAVNGYCIVGEPCEIFVLARRLPRAVPCRIMRDETTFAFYNLDLTQRVDVQRVDTRQQRNLSDGWAESAFTVITPRDLEGESSFVFVNTYNQCLGPSDTYEVIQESDLIPVEIRRNPPAESQEESSPTNLRTPVESGPSISAD